MYQPTAEAAALFQTACRKRREDLTEIELRAVIACYGFLSDDERAAFRIRRADLTPEEIAGYASLQLLDDYFPEG
jgi:hypothetical protein